MRPAEGCPSRPSSTPDDARRCKWCPAYQAARAASATASRRVHADIAAPDPVSRLLNAADAGMASSGSAARRCSLDRPRGRHPAVVDSAR